MKYRFHEKKSKKITHLLHAYIIYFQAFCVKEQLCVQYNYNPSTYTCEFHPAGDDLTEGSGWTAYEESIEIEGSG